MLVLKGLSQSFNDHLVLAPLDLEVAFGEFMVIVGPSGSGKSTLLRLVAGLDEVSSGALFLNGKPMIGVHPAKRDIAMVFQDYALYPHLSVFDNMAFGLKMRKMKSALIQTRVQEVAARLSLTDYLSRKPHQLSGGQKQRVAIGRALVREPRLFLFDEPLSNLDASLRGQLRLEIKRLHQTSNMTALYVTHDQMEAMALATRILVLNEGRVEQCASPQDIYHRPATLFVAQFMGAYPLNILKGKIHVDSKHVILSSGVTLPLTEGESYPPGTTVCVGVRPEDLCSDVGGSLSVTELLVEPMGADMLVRVMSELSETPLLLKMSSQQHENHCVERVSIKRAHFFLEKTGKRIGGWDAKTQQATRCESAY